VSLGYRPLFGMKSIRLDMISLKARPTFRKRVGEYQKSGVIASLQEDTVGNRMSLFEADF
jgi:hypothetical protein